MAADGPPGRAGDAHADAKNKADERGGKDADPVFAAVACVDEAEERGSDPRRLPECAAWGSSSVEDEAREKAQQGDGIDAPYAVAFGAQEQVSAHSGDEAQRPPEVDAAGEREQQIAAEEPLLNAAHQQKGTAPQRAKAEDRSSGKRRRAEVQPAAAASAPTSAESARKPAARPTKSAGGGAGQSGCSPGCAGAR